MDLGAKGMTGIRNKIHAQINFFRKSNMELEYIYPENGTLLVPANFNLDNHVIYKGCDTINSLLKKQNLNDYSAIYVRFARFSNKLFQWLKCAQKRGIKVILEIPTYPFVQEDYLICKRYLQIYDLKNALRVCGRIAENKILSLRAHRYISRVATYSLDEYIWKIKAINISNGYDIDNFSNSRMNSKSGNSNIINFICVSSCLEWHGYDRFIEGLRLYYSNDAKYEARLIIVGEGPELNRYKKMVIQYSLQDKVLFEGKKEGKELEILYENADIALDAMGRHRSRVYYNSSLKGKEYAARGLPIVSGVITEFDYDKGYKYYYRVPADESPIDIKSVIDFYKKIQEQENYKAIIMNYAKTHFSYEVVLKPIVDYINEKNVEETI